MNTAEPSQLKTSIACLGWGSLVWDPREFPAANPWRSDGPLLPIEFARQSRDGRITLVIAPDSAPVTVLWTTLRLSSIAEAHQALADREGVSSKYLRSSIGLWSADECTDHAEARAIGKWAESLSIAAVVWTALKPKFSDTYIKPTCDEVIRYLADAPPDVRVRSEEYVRRTPAQIRTIYRELIEQELGWAPIQLSP